MTLEAIDQIAASLDRDSLAALAYDWESWARPKQIAPITPWRSWGFICGRGFGKTKAACQFVIDEIIHGRARRIGFCSFNLDEAERTLVHGESGLIACSPPWFKPETIKGQVIWPNGAIATPFTPEVPQGPRGPEHDLFWASEVAAWPASTRDEFLKNIRYGLRIGLGRFVFDSTPRARNPLIRYLLHRAQRDPLRHVVVRGSTQENADNLTEGFLDDLRADYAGTQAAGEEEGGIFYDDAEGALFATEWIAATRRDLPRTLRRRVISIDPAISTRKGTDDTGIVELGLGTDDQVYVIDDMTDRFKWEAWGELVVKRYLANDCDCVIVERNRGGDAVASNIRACAAEIARRTNRDLSVVVLEPDAPTRRSPGTIYVKETISRKGKALRAEPVASLYKAGRVSHVNGADLVDLEDTMCTWSPGTSGDSPNALDAMVHGVFELAGLSRNEPIAARGSINGATQMTAAIQQPHKPRVDAVAVALLGAGRGGSSRI